MIKGRTVLGSTWDLWRTKRTGKPAIQSRQETRLADLITFARARSTFYRQHYRDLPEHIVSLQDLPPVTKPDLMTHFDDWTTDPAVTRAAVEAFISDLANIGQPYLGRYAVWTTSGITGKPGIFLHDANALAVYDALTMARGYFSWLSLPQLWELEQRRWRYAFMFAANGHFASYSFARAAEEIHFGRPRIQSYFTVHMPLPELVQALNTFQPLVLVSYPSVIDLLAQEQQAGRLRIQPFLLVTGGEWLSPKVRQVAGETFQAQVHEVYGSTECIAMAADCAAGHLHLNADWCILEPVDQNYNPVPPGQLSHTVLLTNLVNRIQPIIRYDLGDSVTLIPEVCPCGSPLPVIHVEGRRDEILTFAAPDGSGVRVPPQALMTIMETCSGVQRFQLIQVAPTSLKVRLEVSAGADRAQVWDRVSRQVRDYFVQQGIPTIEIMLSPEAPQPHPINGKFRHIWAEMTAAT